MERFLTCALFFVAGLIANEYSLQYRQSFLAKEVVEKAKAEVVQVNEELKQLHQECDAQEKRHLKERTQVQEFAELALKQRKTAEEQVKKLSAELADEKKKKR